MAQPGRQGIFCILLVAWALVVLRSAIYLCYEHANFESDQAIYGLMAKHIVEGRAFPLFMYGQDYMLAVDSYLAAPFFAVLGPSVFSLHLSGLATNLAIASVLIFALVRYAELPPWQALVASLPFVFAPPATSAELTEAGGNIGQFLYVPLLWLLRRRAVAFGALLAVGTMHREFTAYALPVIVLQEAMSGEFWRMPRLRSWVMAMVVAAATWQAGQALRPFSDVLGPGTRGVSPRPDAGVEAVLHRMAIVPAEFPERIVAMLRHHFPSKFGAEIGDSSAAAQGHRALYWPFMLGLGFAAVAAGEQWTRRRRERGDRDLWARRLEFPIYLTGIGLAAMAGYVVTRPAEPFVDRYALLIIYLPVGIVAACLATRPARSVAALAMAPLLLTAVASAADHRVLAARYLGGHEHNDLRVLADELERRQIHVAIANYWRAYRVTFYTQERVKIASSGYVRIDEYQDLARAAGDRLIVIQERPCAGGDVVDGWYLCPDGRKEIP